ncbi:FG-GAP-like repeat-containing protein [Neorhodopirellula pilleata]|nr:FG-GAP-like repeat-containing protein [Neorhodopirellula pilleata]
MAREELRILGSIPEFTLTDQAGKPYFSSELDGKIWVATFIFTRCTATCPFQTAAMADLQRELRSRGELGPVELVSITVDPEFDQPDVLLDYAKGFKADFDHWHFLTGDRDELWELCKDGFKMNVESARDATTLITHSQALVLIDHDAQIRGYYPALSEDAKIRLRSDIQKLLDEQNPDRFDEVTQVDVPEDVRDPAWLTDRAVSQIKKAESYEVLHDFKFQDQLEQTQITFHDQVVEDVKRDFKAAHYDHGAAVAVADVDNDGWLDLYFVCQLGTNELWRNLGNGKFEDITDRAGVGVPDEVSVGASFADVDNDGDADLYVTRIRAGNKLFLNDGKGNFTDFSAESGLDHVGHSSGAVFFDYDRDGLVDLLLTNVGKYTTEQRGPGGYYLAYAAAFMGHLHEERHEANLLFRNLGGGRFKDVSEAVGFNDKSWSGDASPIDANEDGWPDIYLLNMQGHDEYYENQQGKKFVKRSRELFPESAWGTMGVKTFDFDRDGMFDLFVTDMHTDMVHALDPAEEKSKMRRNLPNNVLATDGNHILGNAFYKKTGKDQYTEVSDSIGAENYWPWGISVADLNADGFEDVFIAASMSYNYRYGINSVLLNENGKRFVDSEFILGVEPRSKGSAQPWMELDCSGEDAGHPLCKNHGGKLSVWAAVGTRSSVIFDLDHDGDLDIVTHDFGGTPSVLISDLTDRHTIHYLEVNLVGGPSNRDGFGAIVEIGVGDRTLRTVNDGKSGYLSQSRIPLYFGLGEAKSVDSIRVLWPSGTEQSIPAPGSVNQLITIEEGDDVTRASR